jgi:hypothetical protein
MIVGVGGKNFSSVQRANSEQWYPIDPNTLLDTRRAVSDHVISIVIRIPVPQTSRPLKPPPI